MATSRAHVCKAETDYLSFKARKNVNLAQKHFLRYIYQNAQTTFDSKFRYFKRKHKKSEFEDLENLAKTSPNEMWAKLKKLSNPPSTKAALEIVREDGSILTNMQEILKRWHGDFQGFFQFAFDDDF